MQAGINIGRYKVRNLMREAGLVSKQPGAHAYKVAKHERPDIANHLDRAFEVSSPNRVWCGDITYSVPIVQGEYGCSNEPRVYLK
jgi:transposase InsO family protein